ncbi:LysR family transcriptional regulator YbhD [plant metagenome]|uniref:LysR family transcriptional regulator YbhD n=2 Tax=root TaxID=1 RepID=A0A1C3JYK9_9BURK|nr:LysR family transcriptional regulator [Orrella dioscoreae]SBT24234.1 LysR family transcriptional regulator YbhD [Orrella dioscoreae]SOE49928.1 LysR family transcriptional regulator YbhD [Orrella dioscoreae]
MNLSTRQLRAFVALADERHFTRAAARCHLTQPAFSAMIRGIEDDAGVKLFHRSTRHVELTAEGAVLDASARRLLADFDLVMADLQDHAARRRGHVALAALPSLAAGWLPAILADFKGAYPGISLDLRDALLGGCLEMVHSGRVDFAVAARGPDMNELETVLLQSDRYHLVCPAEHPLAQQAKVRMQDVVRWPMIQLARNSSVRVLLEDALGAQLPPPVLEVEHLATVAGLVMAGLGVTVVPAMTLFHFRRPELAIRPLAGKGLARALYLIKREGRTLSVAAETLYQLLMQRRGEIGARNTPAGLS